MRNGCFFLTLITALLLIASCKKEPATGDSFTYYEVGLKGYTDWRDTVFVVRTNNPQLIQQADAELSLPISQRKLVSGKLLPGGDGYNKNSSHVFGWHLDEQDWQLVDVTIELIDGRPYSDVDQNLAYWLNTVGRYGSWNSYLKRKLPGKP